MALRMAALIDARWRGSG